MAQMGGFLMGNSHARGGVPGMVKGRQPIEMEGGEYIINKEAAQILGPSLLNRLNNADKGGYANEYQGGGYTNNADMRTYDEIPSLLELSLPILGDRLQEYTHGGPIAPITPGGPGGMYAELGYEEPDPSLEYQPLIMPYSFLGEQQAFGRARGSLQYEEEGGGGFGETGFGGVRGSEAEEKRLEAQSLAYHDVASQRQDYLSDWSGALFKDVSAGIFTPEKLGCMDNCEDIADRCAEGAVSDAMRDQCSSDFAACRGAC